MNRSMGIIFALGNTGNMLELTKKRAISAIPVGGKYRVIDFPLSNMVNAGIVNIWILAQYNYRSLMDHLGSGKEWDLDRKKGGLFIFPPYLNQSGTGWYRGTADALFSNQSYLKRSDEEYVLISDGHLIFKANFNDMLSFHNSKDSDMTIMVNKMNKKEVSSKRLCGQVKLDDNQVITDYVEKPIDNTSDICSMNVFLIKRKLLISLIQDCIAHGNYDFIVDIVIKSFNKLKVHGFFHSGYYKSMSTIEDYYDFNMDLLNPSLLKELFVDNGKIFTKIKDEVPAKYNEEADVKNSIVADGCVIEGKVENSVLFRGVVVNRGVTIKNSIIMQDSIIDLNSSLEYVIVDKEVRITENKHLRGESTCPLIIGKKAII